MSRWLSDFIEEERAREEALEASPDRGESPGEPAADEDEETER